MIAFIYAIPEEIAHLRRLLSPEKISFEKNHKIYKARYREKEFLLLRGGMGREVEGVVRFALERFQITALISLGFAGALVPQLRVGDIILCHTLYCEGERPCHSEPDLISKALKASCPRLLQGSSLTVSEPVLRAGEKGRLGKAFPAQVVDMEGYWVGRIASLYGVPFLSAKAISDTLEDDLPPFIKGSKSLLMGAILYCLKNPSGFGGLFRLRENALRAGEKLGEFAKAFLQTINK